MPHRHPLPQMKKGPQTLPMCRIPSGSYLDFHIDVPLRTKKFVPVGDPDSYGRDLCRAGVPNWEEIVQKHKDALPPPIDWKLKYVNTAKKVIRTPRIEKEPSIPNVPTKILKAVKKLF